MRPSLSLVPLDLDDAFDEHMAAEGFDEALAALALEAVPEMVRVVYVPWCADEDEWAPEPTLLGFAYGPVDGLLVKGGVA